MDKVRKTCIANNWYTNGTIKDYDNLLINMCDWDINHTEKSIREIATDIYYHSSNFDNSYTADEHIDNISYYILNDCCALFIS